MEMFSNLWDIIAYFESIATSFDEGFSYINIKGEYSDGLSEHFLSLNQEVEKTGLLINFSFDDEYVFKNDISTFGEYDSWFISITKKTIVKDNAYIHCFYSKEYFLKWAKEIDPFDEDYIVNTHEKLKIIVNNIPSFFGGSTFIVANDVDKDFGECLYSFPDESEVTQLVHCVSEKLPKIKILNNFITTSTANDEYAKIFLNNSILVLTAAIINEFYNIEKVILRGVKRVQLRLIDNDFHATLNQVYTLGEVISWIYEDKKETKRKLFIDRITLDIDYAHPLIPELIRIASSAFEQAKERYNFVIIDRQENYLKEVRDLLKDMKSQSDLYSKKVRNLLSNLLRDVLAGFLLVGFSLLPKVTEITNLVKLNNFFEVVFRALSVYFVISAVVQIAIDITDVIISKKEMLYWKNVSRSYIPEKEFKTHIKRSLKNRIYSVVIFYVLLFLCYSGIAYVCWNYPRFWGEYMSK